MQASPIANSIA